jgi:trehalose-phosphatase
MSENLLVCWKTVERWLRHKNIFLFLDYDGTLTPIVSRPKEAVLDREVKGTLQHLAGLPNCKVAIVSGRSLVDVKSMVGIEDIYYAGNHGLEISGPGIDFNSSDFQKQKVVLDNIRQDLEKSMSGIKGVFIENKGLTLSFHYRMVAADDWGQVGSLFRNVVRGAIERGQIRIVSGKKVFEIRPPVDWDKGSVVAWLLERLDFKNNVDAVGPVYIGDDTTDEDAFRFLKNWGLTVWVGESHNRLAKYMLKGPADVFEFLKRLFSLLSEG